MVQKLSGKDQYNHKWSQRYKKHTEERPGDATAGDILGLMLLALKMEGERHEPRNADGLQKLERPRTQIFRYSLQKEQSPANLILGQRDPLPISDLKSCVNYIIQATNFMATCYNGNRKLIQDTELSQREAWQPCQEEQCPLPHWCYVPICSILICGDTYDIGEDDTYDIRGDTYDIGEDAATVTRWEMAELCPSIKAEHKLVNLSESTFGDCQNLIRNVQKPRNADK